MSKEQLEQKVNDIASEVGIPKEFMDYIGSKEFLAIISQIEMSKSLTPSSDMYVARDQIKINALNKVKIKFRATLGNIANDELINKLINYVENNFNEIGKAGLEATKSISKYRPKLESKQRKQDRLDQLSEKNPKLIYNNSPKFQSAANFFVNKIGLIKIIAKANLKRKLKKYNKNLDPIVKPIEVQLDNLTKIVKGKVSDYAKLEIDSSKQAQAKSSEFKMPTEFAPPPLRPGEMYAVDADRIEAAKAAAKSAAPQKPQPQVPQQNKNASVQRPLSNNQGRPLPTPPVGAQPKPVDAKNPNPNTQVTTNETKPESNASIIANAMVKRRGSLGEDDKPEIETWDDEPAKTTNASKAPQKPQPQVPGNKPKNGLPVLPGADLQALQTARGNLKRISKEINKDSPTPPSSNPNRGSQSLGGRGK